jgi:hypothetical protein
VESKGKKLGETTQGDGVYEIAPASNKQGLTNSDCRFHNQKSINGDKQNEESGKYCYSSGSNSSINIPVRMPNSDKGRGRYTTVVEKLSFRWAKGNKFQQGMEVCER